MPNQNKHISSSGTNFLILIMIVTVFMSGLDGLATLLGFAVLVCLLAGWDLPRFRASLRMALRALLSK